VRLPEAALRPGSAPFVGIGRGFGVYPELAGIAGLSIAPADARALPVAREMARLGAARLLAGGGMDPGFLEPLYVRDKVAMTEAERGARTVGK
jgi:tRNA threonylcarbamoyladenosine biosynthesis protein TsaB